jgi:hypothetical protein
MIDGEPVVRRFGYLHKDRRAAQLPERPSSAPAFVGGAISEILGALTAWRWIPSDALAVVASAPPVLAASGRARASGAQ